MRSVLSFIGSIDVRYILKYPLVPYHWDNVHCVPDCISFLSLVLIHTSFIWSCLTSCWLQCQLSCFLGHLQDQKMWTHSSMQQCLRLLDETFALFFSPNFQLIQFFCVWHHFCNPQESSLVILVVRKLLLSYITGPSISLNSASYSIYSEGSQPGVLQRVSSAAGMVVSLMQYCNLNCLPV